MTDKPSESPETKETPEHSTPEKTAPLGPKGRAAMQDSRSVDDLYIRDQEQYLDKLFKYKLDMQKINNQQAVNDTDEEIKIVNERIMQTLQKKYNAQSDKE